MQSVSVNILPLVIGLVIFSIIMIWWSSTLMLARGRVGGGIHVLLLGCIVSFDAGVVFYEITDISSMIGLTIVTFVLVVGSWLHEVKIRRQEKESGAII